MNRNITSIILIILAVGIYYTVTDDQLAQANEVKAVNDEYAKAIQSSKELIKIRDKVLNDYNMISPDDIERMNKMIPSTVDNIRLIIDLNAIARDHGLAIENIKATVADNPLKSQVPVPGPSPVDTGMVEPTLDRIKVSFSVTAPYQQFILFLQSLESNLRIMDVDSLSVQTADTGMYDFSVSLTTYWLRQ